MFSYQPTEILFQKKWFIGEHWIYHSLDSKIDINRKHGSPCWTMARQNDESRVCRCLNLSSFTLRHDLRDRAPSPFWSFIPCFSFQRRFWKIVCDSTIHTSLSENIPKGKLNQRKAAYSSCLGYYVQDFQGHNSSRTMTLHPRISGETWLKLNIFLAPT